MRRGRTWRRFVGVAGVIVGGALAGCAGQRIPNQAGGVAIEGAQVCGPEARVPVALQPATLRTATPALLALGRRTYEKLCAACHGRDGRGDGEAASVLSPKPRNFTTGKYALVSTWDRIPTDEDLYKTISRGMPGSAMPSWGYLSEMERWGLVHYIKTFAGRTWTVQPASASKLEGETGTGVIRVPPEPPLTPEARALALERYADGCASCHGRTGRGDSHEELKDEQGYPVRPPDLTLGVLKGSPDPRDLYRLIVAGMPGTPMPMSDWAYGEDAWHLVRLIRSWSTEEQRARVELELVPRQPLCTEGFDRGPFVGWARLGWELQ